MADARNADGLGRTRLNMKDKDARKAAIKNWFENRSDAQNDSYDGGGHGVTGVGGEEELLNSLIDDYLKFRGGGGEVRKRRPPTPKGRYVNKPEWNI